MRSERGLFGGLALVCASLSGEGCGGAQIEVAGGAAPPVEIVVSASDDANARRPFYVLVRSVDEKLYVEESYQMVAGKVMGQDESVLRSELIFPGSSKSIALTKAPKGAVGVYFLLTFPDGEWRALIPAPVPGRLDFKVEGNRVRWESR